MADFFFSKGSCYWRYTPVLFWCSSCTVPWLRDGKDHPKTEAFWKPFFHPFRVQSVKEGHYQWLVPTSYMQSHALQSSRNFNNRLLICWIPKLIWKHLRRFFWVNRSTLREINPSPFHHLVDFPIGNRFFRPPSIHWCVRAWQWSRSPTPRRIACALSHAAAAGAQRWFTLSPAIGFFFRTNGERMCINRTRELT